MFRLAAGPRKNDRYSSYAGRRLHTPPEFIIPSRCFSEEPRQLFSPKHNCCFPFHYPAPTCVSKKHQLAFRRLLSFILHYTSIHTHTHTHTHTRLGRGAEETNSIDSFLNEAQHSTASTCNIYG